MINVNELRIGNFIFDDDGIISKVVGFKPYAHSVRVRCDEEEGCDILVDLYPQNRKVRKPYAIESTSVNPIPLTPEWLERCGFKRDGHERWIGPEYKTDNSIQWFEIEEDKKPGLYWLCGSEWVMGRPFQYLHQLQNLCFTLTGGELKIEL